MIATVTVTEQVTYEIAYEIDDEIATAMREQGLDPTDSSDVEDYFADTDVDSQLITDELTDENMTGVEDRTIKDVTAS